METPTTQNPNPNFNGLIDRAKAILLQPKVTWAIIDAEPTPYRSLFMNYVLPLAAIAPIAAAFGSTTFGISLFGISTHVGLMAAVQTAIIAYLMALATVFILAFIINELANSFGGTKDFNQAFKVAAYSSTASWIAGIFSILPFLSILGLLGFYSLYLLYVGLPILMKAPEDKSLGYVIVTILVTIVITAVAGGLVGGAAGASRLAGNVLADKGAGIFSAKDKQVSVNIPGLGPVNVDEMKDATKQIEDTAKAVESGQSPVTPIGGDDLKSLLPTAIMGAAKANESLSSGAAQGINMVTASADYKIGNGTVSLTVSDMASMAGFGAMANALNVNASSSSNGSYSKVTTEDGKMITESYDQNTKSGEYAIVLDGRVVISARGTDVDMAAIKSAAGAVDLSKAKALAK